MIVVIPSNRGVNLNYIEPFLNYNCRVIIVDDTEDERISVKASNIEVFHHSDRKKYLGELEDCIPRKNGACRDFGLLVAYREGEMGETVICLDDDCKIDDEYIPKASNALGLKTLVLAETKHPFYNPLDIYDLEMEIYPRGFPYEERGRPRDYNYTKTVTGNVVFNLGLWNGVFDVNAIDKHYLDKFSFSDVPLRYSQVAVVQGPLLSLCSMNMIMVKELIPAIYQLPMNEPIIPHWKIDRYGDIWGGYISKKLIDIRGDILSVGEPVIYHDKDGNIEKNILQEHYAHIVNLQFCELIARACEDIPPGNYLDMYDAFCSNLEVVSDSFPRSLEGYLKPTIEKMNKWVSALRRG